MSHTPKCKCSIHSPFRWAESPEIPSIFYADKAMRALKKGVSKSHAATMVIDKQKREGKSVDAVKGLNRNKEAEMLRVRDFATYSKAKRKDLLGVEVLENGNVAA